MAGTDRLKEDLTGKRFGRLLVISYVGRVGKAPSWACRCSCGAAKVIPGGNLRSGRVMSCGCFHADEMTARQTTHGMRNTPEYKAWCNIKARCSNPKTAQFDRYGGRGIAVCAEWETSFEQFYADMGPRPSTGHSIDRKDVNANYSPENCRWATRREQMANTSRNKFVEVNGIPMIQAEAARQLGITVSGLRYRMRQGPLTAGAT